MSARNGINYLSYAACTAGQTPTKWQRDTYPASFHDRIRVIHEGIDTRRLTANPQASAKLGRLDQAGHPQDELFTYMARNMEPMRGFHVSCVALPQILAARPKARALIIGGNDVSYGVRAGEKGGFRARMARELGDRIDWSRVHFLGKVPYNVFVATLQLSRCHIYMTMPFVLSWVDAGGDVDPGNHRRLECCAGAEVDHRWEDGILVDFFSPDMLARKVIDVLSHRRQLRRHRAPARARTSSSTMIFWMSAFPRSCLYDELLPKRLRGAIVMTATAWHFERDGDVRCDCPSSPP